MIPGPEFPGMIPPIISTPRSVTASLIYLTLPHAAMTDRCTFCVVLCILAWAVSVSRTMFMHMWVLVCKRVGTVGFGESEHGAR
jgi:hypothetical protein